MSARIGVGGSTIGSRAHGLRGRVLIVADERVVALELEDRVRRLGFDVVGSFGDGDDALRHAAALRPDLALVDLRLGGATASELERAHGIPVVYVTDADGALLATIEAALIRHQAERAQREAEDARRHAEARYAAILDVSPDAIVSVDAAQRIVAFNRIAERVFGYRADEVLGQPLELLLPESAWERHRAHVEATRASREGARSMGGRRRLSARRRDGSEFPIEASVSKLDHGDEVLLTAVVRDVSDRRALEEKVRHAENMEAVGRLASGVVHDLANLLAIVQHAAELVGRELPVDAAPNVDAITGAVARGSALTKRILSYAGGASAPSTASPLDQLVHRARDLIRHVAGGGVNVELDLRAGEATVVIDPHRFEQILLNCVANARDAMPQGGRVAIRTSRAQEGSHALLEIEDNGPGMPPHVAARALEPFFTTKEPGRGTGLGLATVRDCVHEAGGAIEIRTALGSGTTIGIRLPCHEPTALAPAAPAEPGPPSDGVAARVLLVDDEDMLCRLLSRALRHHGFDVVAASGAGEALAYLESGDTAFDVLVTDSVLPLMSGKELAERMRRFLPRLKVLYMTGNVEEAVGRLGVPSDAVLSKPFPSDELAARIARLVGPERRPSR